MSFTLGENDKDFLRKMRVRPDPKDDWAEQCFRWLKGEGRIDELPRFCRCGRRIHRFYMNGQPSNCWIHEGDTKARYSSTCDDGKFAEPVLQPGETNAIPEGPRREVVGETDEEFLRDIGIKPE